MQVWFNFIIQWLNASMNTGDRHQNSSTTANKYLGGNSYTNSYTSVGLSPRHTTAGTSKHTSCDRNNTHDSIEIHIYLLWNLNTSLYYLCRTNSLDRTEKSMAQVLSTNIEQQWRRLTDILKHGLALLSAAGKSSFQYSAVLADCLLGDANDSTGQAWTSIARL